MEIADNKEMKPVAEHQCHECAKFLKKGCINLFPLRVKPTARACKSFIDPVLADKIYCCGAGITNMSTPKESITECQIRDRCARFNGGHLPGNIEGYVNVQYCTKHGYPDYIRKEKK